MKLFIDLDGVMANFDQAYFDLFGEYPDRNVGDKPGMWEKINDHGSFYKDMVPMPDAHILWEFVKIFDPTILTGVPKNVSTASSDKKHWVRETLGKNIPVITCPSKHKSLHCKPGDILVDDWEQHKQKWIDVGGIWITHVSAENSIHELVKLIKQGKLK
jgi:hypothetical protein